MPLIDHYEAYWARVTNEPMAHHHAVAAAVAEGSVLDVGGGDGALASVLTEQGHSVTVVDWSITALNRTAGTPVRADVTRPLPFRDKAFGTACASNVVEHVFEPAELVREMARVAQEIVLAVPNFNYWRFRWDMLRGRTPPWNRPKHRHIYWFNIDAMNQMLSVTGLTPVSRQYIGLRRYGRIGRFLANRWPNLFADTFIARLRA